MAVSTQEPVRENQTDSYPLLTEPFNENANNEYVIHIERGNEASSSASPELSTSHNLSPSQPPTASSPQVPDRRSLSYSSTRTSSRNSSFGRRHDRLGRGNWSPLNSGLWISIELIFTMSQIMASIIVLSISRDEKPHTPLFSWIVGYTLGCCTSIPIIYWRYLHRNYQNTEQDTSSPNQDSPRGNSTSHRNSYVTISLGQSANQDDHLSTSRAPYNSQTSQPPNPRLGFLFDHLKMALDCFFAVWFVVGNVWIFGGRSSALDAPNLYRLCIAYLTLSCIGYAMPFILCAMICCCLPCIISLLGIREDQSQVQGASEDSINALPTHKFQSKKDENGSAEGLNGEEVEEGGRGGTVAAGTEKERVISSEDAVCCICLATFIDNDELRELPCSHFFHSECVDKWLKINATCPLCKAEIIPRSEDPAESQTDAILEQSEGNSNQQT